MAYPWRDIFPKWEKHRELRWQKRLCNVGILVDADIIMCYVQRGQKLIDRTHIAQTVMSHGRHKPMLPGKGGDKSVLVHIHCLFQQLPLAEGSAVTCA